MSLSMFAGRDLGHGGVAPSYRVPATAISGSSAEPF